LIQFVINNWYLFLALAVVIVLLVMPNAMQRAHGIQSLGPSQCVLLVNRESGVFVDVSEPSEFKTGHIANAINVPMNMIDGATPQLDKHKERPIVVVSRIPNRGVKAAVSLRKRGFSKVQLLAGGLAAWEKEGLPVEKS